MLVRDPDPKEFGDLLDQVFDGAPFDEYVFVLTEPFLDDDKETVDILIERAERLAGGVSVQAQGASVFVPGATNMPRFVIAHFPWKDDFAAARNYSFELATCRWRGFLDADDSFPGPFTATLCQHIANFEEGRDEGFNVEVLDRHGLPAAGTQNCISLPYIYAPGDTVQPEKIRFVRWVEGWRWQDEIHEHLVRTNPPGALRGRRHNVIETLPVTHKKKPEDHAGSFARNARIALLAYNATDDAAKRGRMAFYLAEDAMMRGDFQTALNRFAETMAAHGASNLGGYAYTNAVRILSQEGHHEQAIDFAGQYVGRQPESQHAWQVLGYAHAVAAAVEASSWLRATHAFGHAASLPGAEMSGRAELWFEEGLVRYWHARALLEGLGDHRGALEKLAEIPPVVQTHDLVHGPMQSLRVSIGKERLFQATEAFVEALVHSDQSPVALEVLKRCSPAPIAADPRLAEIAYDLRKKTSHVKLSKDAARTYFDRYANLPSYKFHTDPEHRQSILNLRRAQVAISWAERAPADSSVLSIGAQDGYIEEAMLEANESLRLLFVDVGPQASKGFERLKSLFGARVERHEMKRPEKDWSWSELFDWYPEGASFDCVLCFEVLEHLPDAGSGIGKLAGALKLGGTLVASVPDSQKWIQAPEQDLDWIPHVEGYNAASFADLFLCQPNLDGVIEEAADGTLVASMVLHEKTKLRGEACGIFVPGTPKPFGPFSHEKGFVGGSEECVIHLAHNLANNMEVCSEVDVFCPDFVDENGSIVRYKEGVFWRPLSEWSPRFKHMHSVLFWRCPEFVASSELAETSFKKILWLHDASYGASSDVYAAADDIVVLSKAHARCLNKYDGVPLEHMAVLANGIDEDSFPPLEPRDRGARAIYASSPDRGLNKLLEIWPAVLKGCPHAHLDIYYDWTVFEQEHPDQAEHLHALCERFSESVTVRGGVDHETLHKALREASVWAYPHEGDAETFCITAVKAMASGCRPCSTNAGALREVAPVGAVVDEEDLKTQKGLDAFANILIKYLKTPERLETRKKYREKALARFGWRIVAKRFQDLMQP